jgi:hypothetical protein
VTELFIVQWLYVHLEIPFLTCFRVKSNVMVCIGSLQQHRMPLRARRLSATFSNWTMHDVPAAGRMFLSCAGRSRSMRPTENVRDTLELEVLRANGASRPHSHSTF